MISYNKFTPLIHRPCLLNLQLWLIVCWQDVHIVLLYALSCAQVDAVLHRALRHYSPTCWQSCGASRGCAYHSTIVQSVFCSSGRRCSCKIVAWLGWEIAIAAACHTLVVAALVQHLWCPVLCGSTRYDVVSHSWLWVRTMFGVLHLHGTIMLLVPLHASNGRVRVCNMDKVSVIDENSGPRCCNWK